MIPISLCYPFRRTDRQGSRRKGEAVLIASGSQIRAARAGLGWSQAELAEHAGNARASGYAATGKAISGGFNFLGGLAGSGAFGSNIASFF